jgi:aminoglycoside phosphotransferase (APT) family kinase protein
VHDLTAGTEFAAGSEVACHPNLSQQNWIFRDMIPVAIIDWDRTAPGTRVSNFAEFLWAFVHPAVYGEGKPAARMLAVAAGAYGWAEGGLVNAMAAIVRNFVAVNPEFIKWGLVNSRTWSATRTCSRCTWAGDRTSMPRRRQHGRPRLATTS